MGAEFEFKPADINLMGFHFNLPFPRVIIKSKEVFVVRKFRFIIHQNKKIQIWKI
jgi:hypothetical protein